MDMELEAALIADMREAARDVVARRTDGEAPRWKVLAVMAAALGQEVDEAPDEEGVAECADLIWQFMGSQFETGEMA